MDTETPTSEPTAVTQELAMRKEDLFMCSQSADPQIDVAWDCHSQDALLHIKYSGQRTTDFMNELGEESDDASGNPDPLPGLWLVDKDEQVWAKPKGRAKRPLRKRTRRTSGSTKDADQIFQRLDLALYRFKGERMADVDQKLMLPASGLCFRPKRQRTDINLDEDSEEESSGEESSGEGMADVDQKLMLPASGLCFRPKRQRTDINLDEDSEEESSGEESSEPADQPLVPEVLTEDPLRIPSPSPSTGSGGLERIEPVDKPLVDRIDSTNTSTDLFESAEIHTGNTALSVAKTSATINDLQKLRTDLSVQDNKIDDQQFISEDTRRDVEEQWSDEDLFENDSLLTAVSSPTPRKTTSLSKRKSSMASPSEPLTKTKRTGRKPSGLEIQPPQSQTASQAGKYQFKSLNSKPSTAKTSRADGSSSNQSRPIVPNGVEESTSVLTRTFVTTSEMKSKGLPVNKPNFMKTPAVKKRQLRVVESDSDSDEEWRPTSKTKNKNVKPFKIPVKFFGERTKVAQVEKKSCGKRRKATPGTISDRSAPSYPKRNRPITNYMDIGVPDDDSFLYCEECNEEYPGDCPDHGALLVIQDKETKNLKQSMLTAEASLPDCVVVKSSSIPNAGLGVFASCPIKSRTRFGPYKGVIISDVDEAHSTGYAWQIYSDGKPGHYVDGSDPKHSNWMRYVNCARLDMEQNLTAFQYKGEVYYRSHQDIAQGHELLVWYGADYGSELGIHKPVLLNKSQGDDQTKLIRTHTGGKPYQCTMCDARFSEKGSLTGHIRTHTGEKPYQCSMCDARFIQKGHLTGHIRTHTGEKPYQCSMCDARFIQKGYLTGHIRTHTGEKPYRCAMCDARFSQKCNLTRHIRTHTREKPYQCSICDARFSEKSHLTPHIRTHTGEKPYHCTMCDARFSVKGNLTKHIRTHTGEKRYQCTMCDARFSKKGHLTVHIRTHTGEKP